ncbi:ABC transporter permease [Zoogloea dura]|uniref:ABC transporter permease n=1 Tax=Zoogloea dura TaxID=2728840 RepID=A0A848G4N8_9RHOO|nr:ABC transporter permease [Zoogloea dura]NML25946.1 ABC transporter permease [Zoogloea dura]
MSRASALLLNVRVIWALVLREIITRYGRENIGFLWLIVEPMLFTGGIAISWSFFASLHGHRIGVLEFAVTGYSSILLWRNCANRAVNGVQPNFDLLYHRRVKVLDVLVARCLLEIASATLSFVVLTVAFVFLDMMPAPRDLMQVMIAWFFLAWVSVAIALVVAALSEMSDLVERVWHVATYLFFPLSGALFMVDWLSPAMQKVVLWIPMVHGLEMLRGGYFGPSIRTLFSVEYLFLFCGICTYLGLLLVKVMSRRVVRK